MDMKKLKHDNATDFKKTSRTFFVVVLACVLTVTVGEALSYWLLPAAWPDYQQGRVEIVTMICILCAVYIACLSLLFNLSSLVDNIVKKNDQIKRDSFTTLLNHSSFYEQLDGMILANHSNGDIFSLVLWDIDNFKSVNDSFGHDVGDKVLLLFVQAVKESIHAKDYAFRYGGEEFAVLTPSADRAAFSLSERVRARFTELCQTLGLGITMTASAGICQYQRKLFGGNREFFSSADHALYMAKRVRGKNTSIVWDACLEERMFHEDGLSVDIEI